MEFFYCQGNLEWKSKWWVSQTCWTRCAAGNASSCTALPCTCVAMRHGSCDNPLIHLSKVHTWSCPKCPGLTEAARDGSCGSCRFRAASRVGEGAHIAHTGSGDDQTKKPETLTRIPLFNIDGTAFSCLDTLYIQRDLAPSNTTS